MIPIPSKNALSIFCVAVVFALGGSAEAQFRTTERQQSSRVVDAARDFLDRWLVKRDVNTAMDYVSATPVLGTCARPSALTGKKQVSSREHRTAIKSILRRVTRMAQPKRILNAVIEPVEITPSDEQNVATDEPFALFLLTHKFGDARFLCKFDDDVKFRRAFASAGVWYMTFKLKGPESSDLSWILAWRKEGGEWRLFSLAPLED